MTRDIEHIDPSLALFRRLEEVLDIYGPEPLKWPEDERSRLLAFIGTSSRAQKLLDEAHALDYVLSHNSVNEPDLSDLQSRILNQLPPAQKSRDNVTRLPLGNKRDVTETAGYSREILQSALLLAASLIIGVSIGLTDFANTITNLGNDENVDITSIFESDGEDQRLPPEEGFL